MKVELIRKNIQRIMDEELQSNQAFSLKTGISLASLSHILSSRNKPTLDVVLKIVAAFPTVSLDWFLLNKGPMRKQEGGKDLGEIIELILELKLINKLNNNNLSNKINQIDKLIKLTNRQ